MTTSSTANGPTSPRGASSTAPPSSTEEAPAPRSRSGRSRKTSTGQVLQATAVALGETEAREVVSTHRIRDQYEADESGHYRVTRSTGEDRNGRPVTYVTRKEIVSARVRIVAAYADDLGEPYPISATEVPDRTRPTVTHYDLTVSRPEEGAVDLPDVPAEAFAKAEWTERAELADLPVVTASGPTAKNDIATAIKLSSPHPVIPAYSRLGWHYRGGRWFYVHGGGAWSAEGAMPDVRVHGDGLGTFAMAPPPETEEAGRRAFSALWDLFDMGPDRFAAVEIGAAFRASMGRASGSMTYRAINQSGKSGRMAFIAQCWAPSVRWNRLPFNAGKQFATPAYIEHVHHVFGDMIVPWDDMAPVGSPRERADYFDMFARSLFNGASKGRMGIQDRKIKARARLRPRAFGALSAEDVTPVESGQNRTHIVPLSREEFEGAAFEAADADTGPEDRSALMSAFIVWWAARMPAHAYVRDLEARFRADLTDATGAPGRYVESVADKAAGLYAGLEFAQARGWVEADRAGELWERAWSGLCESLRFQVEAIAGQSMPDRIRDAILDGLAVGEAHLLALDGGQPENHRACGWDGQSPRGHMIGWTDGSRHYLLPSAACGFVAEYASRSGAPVEITSRAMGEALETAGYITGSEENRNGRKVHRHTIPMKVCGQKKNVWALRIPEASDGPDSSGPGGGQGGPKAPQAPGSPEAGPACRAGCGQPFTPTDDSGYHAWCDPAVLAGWGPDTIGGEEARRAASTARPVPAPRSAPASVEYVTSRAASTSTGSRTEEAPAPSGRTSGWVCVYGSEGLTSPEGKPVPVEGDTLADALHAAVSAAPAGTVAQVIIDPAANASLGIRGRLPQPGANGKAPKQPAFVQQLRAAGWGGRSKTGDVPVRAWNVFQHPRHPGAVVHVVVRHWLTTDGGAWGEKGEPSAAWAARISRVGELSGHPWGPTDGKSAADLHISIVRDKSLRRYRKWPMWQAPGEDWRDALGSAADCSNLAWKVEEEAGAAFPYRHQYDARYNYLASYSEPRGLDPLTHTGAVPFDKRRDGMWLVERPAWDRLDLPAPWAAMGGNGTGTGPVWVTTPVAVLMTEQDLPVTVLDSWTSEKHPMPGGEEFVTRVRDALKVAEAEGDRVVIGALKQHYRALHGAWKRGPYPLRPDWFAAVKSESACRILRKIYAVEKATKRTPLKVDVDAVVYGSHQEDPLTDVPPLNGKRPVIGDGLGQFKVKREGK